MFDYKLFCKNIKLIRESKNLSQHEMAIQCDMSDSYYSLIENGNSEPNFKVVIAIANALKTDISSLFTNKKASPIITSIKGKIKPISDRILLDEIYNITLLIKTHKGIDNENL